MGCTGTNVLMPKCVTSVDHCWVFFSGIPEITSCKVPHPPRNIKLLAGTAVSRGKRSAAALHIYILLLSLGHLMSIIACIVFLTLAVPPMCLLQMNGEDVSGRHHSCDHLEPMGHLGQRAMYWRRKESGQMR
jgi:hypothetical protein